MKLLFLGPNKQSCHQFYGYSMALRALLFSTQAPPPLKRMIMRTEEEDGKTSVVPILENWVQQGNEIKHSKLRNLIRILHHRTRFRHALQISQWMSDKGVYELSAEDFAAQLELTSRVYGLDRVETYFDAIPNNLRGYKVYCALLRSYAHLGRHGHGGCVEKGEAAMQQLRELGFARNASTYNAMLSFYCSAMGAINEIDILAEEMREKGINYNRYTYNLLLKGHGNYLSVKRMEEFLTELEADPLVNIDWYHYLLAAKGYRASEQLEKAFTMLRKSEESIEGNLSGFAFEKLLTAYGVFGSKADVYRLWSLRKPKEGFYHRAYYKMCYSLIELDDTEGAERIWEEWFSNYSRIPKATIAAMNITWEKEVYSRIPQYFMFSYCAELENCEAVVSKCEAIVSRVRESGIELDADILNELAKVYCECEQMDKAVETEMKAISVSKPGWLPCLYVINCCFEYLESQEHVVAREDFSKMLKEQCTKTLKEPGSWPAQEAALVPHLLRNATS